MLKVEFRILAVRLKSDLAEIIASTKPLLFHISLGASKSPLRVEVESHRFARDQLLESVRKKGLHGKCPPVVLW